MSLTLTVIEGPHAGRTFHFTEHETFLVGRSSKAHFRLPSRDKYFSRLHFMVEVNPPLCRIHDMGSHNGTYVNGQRITTTKLKDGDLVRAGHTVLKVELPEPDDEPTQPWEDFVVPPQGPDQTKYTTPNRLPPDPPGSPGRPLTPSNPSGELYTASDPAFQPFPSPSSPLPEWIPPAGTTPAGCPVCDNPVTAGAFLCVSCEQLASQYLQPVPDYRLVRLLGRGGMGVVHLGVRLRDRKVAAIKTVIPAQSANRKHVQRFLREASILCELDHPNIVSFYEMGAAHGQLYFSMEYVAGTDAHHMLEKTGPLPMQTATRLVDHLLFALEYAHVKGFVHRDIKPANLLLITEGERITRVKVADFGLARVYQSSRLSGLTVGNDMGGTFGFMAPEQVTDYRNVQPPADQFSAAATLYYLLTGKRTYDLSGDISGRLYKVLHEDPIPILQHRPDLPASLAQIIHRALARDPGHRFPDVPAFRRALEPFAR